MRGERVSVRVALHQLAEGDLDAERLLQLQRDLGERQRVEAELDEGRGGVGASTSMPRPARRCRTACAMRRSRRDRDAACGMDDFGSGLPVQRGRNGRRRKRHPWAPPRRERSAWRRCRVDPVAPALERIGRQPTRRRARRSRPRRIERDAAAHSWPAAMRERGGFARRDPSAQAGDDRGLRLLGREVLPRQRRQRGARADLEQQRVGCAASAARSAGEKRTGSRRWRAQ